MESAPFCSIYRSSGLQNREKLRRPRFLTILLALFSRTILNIFYDRSHRALLLCPCISCFLSAPPSSFLVSPVGFAGGAFRLTLIPSVPAASHIRHVSPQHSTCYSTFNTNSEVASRSLELLCHNSLSNHPKVFILLVHATSYRARVLQYIDWISLACLLRTLCYRLLIFARYSHLSYYGVHRSFVFSSCDHSLPL